MDNDPIEMQARNGSRRELHVLDKASHDEELRSDLTGTRHKIWVGIVVTLFVFGLIGLVVNNKRASRVLQPSSQQERIRSLADQLSTLGLTDLIVFPDGRVWYVRAVHGRNMEEVGWIGDNTRSENIDSFVLKEENLTIVRHDDPRWPMQRDRFLEQQ
jgi:hypothetical protein